ncbi:hypothetical protein Ait01nite_028990 [Actinoplanes italicus]|uniref:Tetratricopeptide repeat protein n=1 Tax=Actinoplanes italicus TaxID=113567 RepID=A0A2T0KIL5_9ACTN|nr:hypothetical protein [Actinoplanes italicus]PRX23354.1 hypothetical protein CLV67_10399 [Actinoplanes italicus]GIE29854.1 hypothetical protein Ait01nite_028990 [Actinoplanes italicus]
MRGSVAGIRVWTSVLLVWFMWAAVTAGAFALAAGLVLRFAGSWGWAVPAGLVAAAVVCGMIEDAELIPRRETGLAYRYALARKSADWYRHARAAELLGRRRPRVAERALRQGLAEGSAEAYVPLARLLEKQDRGDELAAIRAEVAVAAGVQQLQALVLQCDRRIPRDYRAAADFQAALVERDSGNARLRDYLGMLLAESGDFDGALAAHTEVGAIEFRIRTAHLLRNAFRAEEAEALLRASTADTRAIPPLVALMRAQGRLYEAENLLREHPEPDHYVLVTLWTLLRESGREQEAQEVKVPPKPIPPQRSRYGGGSDFTSADDLGGSSPTYSSVSSGGYGGGAHYGGGDSGGGDSGGGGGDSGGGGGGDW